MTKTRQRDTRPFAGSIPDCGPGISLYPMSRDPNIFRDSLARCSPSSSIRLGAGDELELIGRPGKASIAVVVGNYAYAALGEPPEVYQRVDVGDERIERTHLANSR